MDERIDRYQIEEQISEGSAGVVYRATDLPTGQVVALKLLAAGKVSDRVAVGRFLREARAIRELEHPHIVPIVAIERWRDTYYIAMDWIEGTDLLTVVERDGPLPLPEALRCAREIGDALRYAHAHDVVHRDIKPANIVRDEQGCSVLVDFGYAKKLSDPSEGLTNTGMAMGTPHYMSPEQVIDAKHADARTDIYAFGATLYHLLIGEPPFAGAGVGEVLQRMMSESVCPPAERRGDVPPTLSRLIVRMLERDADKRLATMDVVMARLDRIR